MAKPSWSFYNPSNELLPPIKYDNGKDQETIIQEVVEALDDHDIIFLQGGVGTGKSIIALHILAHFNKGIIAVPTKSLEDQYVEDYCGPGKNYLKYLDNQKLPVNNLRGRTNFTCPNPPPTINTIPVDCGNSSLYCTKNPGDRETRVTLGIQCPYWSPIYPTTRLPLLVERTRKQYAYESFGGMKYYNESDTPCPYYHQFRHFVPRGAIIMNSMKWEAETWMGRKPKVAVEIIDEGDAFLDGLSYKTQIQRRNIQTLRREDILTAQELDSLETEFSQILSQYKITEEFELSTAPQIISFLKYLGMLLSEAESASLKGLNYKLAIIAAYIDYAWVEVVNEERSKGLTFYIPRMDITLNELKSRSGKMVLMSATSHSDYNFENIFRIQPHRIYAQEYNPGQVHLMMPSNYSLLNVTNTTWRNQAFKERYWEILDHQLAIAAKPCYVLVHANRYLPAKYHSSSDEKREKYWTRSELPGVRFSTKMDRGIDLRDDLCRSIVLLKYPIPYLGDVLFRTIKKQFGDTAYWEYVIDMANRELLQQCGRAVRNKHDWCQVYSPDKKVVENMESVWKGDIQRQYY